METIKFWMKPALLLVAWVITAGFVLYRLAQASETPVATFYGPVETIEEAEEPGV